ncbi:MAG: glycosyltransferase [Pedosphaera sp.]|nr:glycosyltransferase [Pedosphaera sp.]
MKDRPMIRPRFLVVIPAYNEEARIGPVLRDFATRLRAQYRGPFRVMVVLNGCRDRTEDVVRLAATEFAEVEPLIFHEPIGKGGALIEGFKQARDAEIVAYVDADGATGPDALMQLVDELRNDDCVIGSRWLPGAVLHRSQTRLRRIMSRSFHTIVEAFFWMGIKDTQCPAKVLRRAALDKVIHSLRIADLAFDVNLLVALHRAGCTVREVPIEWTDQAGSKVTASLWRSSLVMFLSVLRLRLIYSPLHRILRLFRPLETWLYLRLHAPPPRPVVADSRKTSPVPDRTS